MSENNKIFLVSQVTDLANSDDKNYLELTNRLCWYDEPNLNNVVLPLRGAEKASKTLIDMPVVAKYKPTRVNGIKVDDLGGHEVSYDPVTKEVRFGTENIGTHTAVEIKEDDVIVNGEEKRLKCLFAKSKIWKRNKNVCNAIQRLYDEGKLHSSWEIETQEYKFENGIKTLTKYIFDANCLLGSGVTPAYGCADTLSVASVEEPELMIAEALSEDISERTTDKEESMNNDEIKTVDEISEEVKEPEVSEEDTSKCEPKEEKKDEEKAEDTESECKTDKEKKDEDSECKTDEEKKDEDSECKTDEEKKKCSEEEAQAVETSALTVYDIERQLYDACNEKLGCDYCCYIRFWFPEEQSVWCGSYKLEKETEFFVFTYEIVDDKVIVSDPVVKELTFDFSEVNSIIAKANAEIVEANKKIDSLNEEISALKPYKEAADKAEAERLEAEKEEKRAELKKYAISSSLISEKEIEEDETIASYIKNVDTAGIDSIIASRYMASRNEVSAKAEKSAPTKDYSSVDSNSVADINKSVISIYLNGTD